MANRLDGWRSYGFWGQAITLAGATMVLLGLVGSFAWWHAGQGGLAAAATAALACFAGEMPAIAVRRLLGGPDQALVRLLIGTATRISVPIAVALAVHFRGGPLAEAGLLYYLVVFYSATLAAEVALSLPAKQRRAAKPEPPAVEEP